MAESFDDVIKTIDNEKPKADDDLNLSDFENMDNDLTDDAIKTFVERDSQGNIFDPAIHTVDAMGLPVKNKTGTFRKRKGRKKESGKQGLPVSDFQAAKAAGQATAQTIVTLGQTIGGEEFKPIIDKDSGIDELQNLADAWTNYYIETGVTAIPAWLTVTIATGGYVLPRLTMPKTKTKVQRLKDWIKIKLFNYQSKKAKDKKDIYA